MNLKPVLLLLIPIVIISILITLIVFQGGLPNLIDSTEPQKKIFRIEIVSKQDTNGNYFNLTNNNFIACPILKQAIFDLLNTNKKFIDVVTTLEEYRCVEDLLLATTNFNFYSFENIYYIISLADLLTSSSF